MGDKKIYRVWYRVGTDEMDFAECTAESEQDARKWFRNHFCETVLDVEETNYFLLEG